MSKKKLYVVDTISSFRRRYVIEAESLEHAYDEVTMVDSGDENDMFEPVSELYMGENIIDGRKIKRTEFDKMLKKLENSPDYRESSSHWLGDQLIRKIDYSSR